MPKDSHEIWLRALRGRLAEAAAHAEPLIRQGRFDEAEQLVRAVDSDIHGASKLGELFTAALRRQPRGARAREVYQRALRWRCAWPSPHTAEEAERERVHVEEVERELKAILDSLP